MEDSKKEPLLLPKPDPYVLGINRERTYKDEGGEVIFRERPDDYVNVLLPRLKDRLDFSKEKKGIFVESLPDDDVCRDVAVCLRLAMSKNSKFADPDFVEAVKEYVEQSPMGAEFGFRLAYRMFTSAYELVDRTWRETYASEEDIEVAEAVVSHPLETALTMVDRKYLGEDGKSIVMPRSEVTDPWQIGEMEKVDKEYFVGLLVKMVEKGSLTEDEYGKLQSLYGRTDPEWTDSNINRDDLEPLDKVLSDKDRQEMERVKRERLKRVAEGFGA